ncbi:class I adenylate-forming enzyme family protein [Pseudonocardia asaccharolytica]|uniref:O-succinylbenzoic acid--CoA ligase n=1 Tax=Pseudonocardia asaccharolytica DSM 44247 = NBRC 16224 TaxID=1123024 RepID=A0A511CXV1_9PSEU|nr:AMP-binding protein [Pseudonocardia asaccharolytica]GEL17399.1 O-succinylbenzoic acid--CoA ligase [Pseudonocardia asaccharolytica DSM 44247 = NBRC 16224]
MPIEPHPRGAAPFDTSEIERDARGIAHYTDLPGSLVAMVRASVERFPDVEALVEIDGERLSYRQLWERAARVAGGLAEAGVGRGDRVAGLLPAGVDWVLGFLGTLLAGAVAVPVNTRFAGPEIDYVLADSGSTLVLRPGEPLPDGEPRAQEGLGPSDLAAIFYTSGTTGFPKGAMTSHENFLSNVETAVRVIDLDRAEGPALRNLVSVPLFHVTGCNSQLLVQLAIGGTTVVLPTFEVQAFLRAVVEERINLLTSAPAIYALAVAQPNFAEFDVSAVTRVAYGGSPIAPSLVARIQERFPNARLGNGFGLTETSSIATFLPHERAAEHVESVGFAAPVVDLALDAVNPASGVGELLIRGPNVVAGYWNQPDATRETFVDGWLHSGDLARIDAEGLVYIVDRVKDMINRGGENVYCVEVENALAGAPGVADAAVVPVPNEVMGEKVGAVVVPLPGGEFDTDRVVAHLRERLADFKVPQFFSVRPEPLPRNPGGKILKRQLRENTTWGEPVHGR